MMRRFSAALIVGLALAGCTKEKREAPLASTGTSGPATLSSMQADIFALGCAISGCHDNRANPAGGLNMTTVQLSHANMVGRDSTQVPGRKLVVPADPDSSYLVDKLLGTHLAVGGTGRRMPTDAAALSQADIDRVIAWINDGAQLN